MNPYDDEKQEMKIYTATDEKLINHATYLHWCKTIIFNIY